MSGSISQALQRVARLELPARQVAIARVGLGIAAVIRGLAAIPLLLPLADDSLLRFPWYAWAPDPSTPLITTILAIWLLSAITFTIGAWTRLSAVVLSTALASSIALDQQAYANHLVLLTVLIGIFVLSDSGAALSIDAKRRGGEPVTIPGWPLFLIKLQVVVVYVFAGVTKLTDSFLSGGVLRAQIGSGLVRPPESILVQSVLAPLAVLAIITELLIAYALWRRPFRKLGVALGIGLHGSIALLMAPTIQFAVFGIVMVSTYPLFLSDPLEPSNEPTLRSVDSDDSVDSSQTENQQAQRKAA